MGIASLALELRGLILNPSIGIIFNSLAFYLFYLQPLYQNIVQVKVCQLLVGTADFDVITLVPNLTLFLFEQ